MHCEISAFGTDGSLARIKGYDSLIAAKAGLFARGAFSHREGQVMFPVPWGSFGAGLEAAAGILCALAARETSGHGQQLSATMIGGLEPLDYFMQVVVQLAAKRGDSAVPLDPRASAKPSRYGVLVCTRDGRFIQTAAQLPHQARALAEVAGIAHHLVGERYAAMPQFASADDAHEYETLLWEAFRQQDLAYWIPRLEADANIGWEVAVTSEQALSHPQFLHNGDVVTVHDEDVGPVTQVGPIAHFGRTPVGPRSSAPRLGEHAGDLTPGAAAGTEGGAAPAARRHYDRRVRLLLCDAVRRYPRSDARRSGDQDRGRRRRPAPRGVGPRRRDPAKTTAGKESVSLDVRTVEGLRAAREIVAHADVFVDGFRAGVSERLGLGWNDLSALNRRLVYIHAGGYGSSGPAAGRACYAQTAQTAAGSFGRQVGYWSAPEQNEGLSVLEIEHVVLPRLNQVVDGDSNAALAVLATIALAVFEQRRSGQGQFVSTSMIAANAWAYADDFCTYAGKTPVPLCDPDFYGTDALNRVYETAAGWVCLAVATEREWNSLAAALDIPELLSDSRFRDTAARREHDDALVDVLGARFAMKPAADWEARLVARGVGCVEASENGLGAFIAEEPALLQSGITAAYEHPRFGSLVRLAGPVRLSAGPNRVASAERARPAERTDPARDRLRPGRDRRAR